MQSQIIVNSPDNTTPDKFAVTVTDQAAIYKQVDGEKQNTGFDSLVEG